MILADERPMTNTERLACWYAKAAHVDGLLCTGPAFGFDWLRAREYEAEAMADSAPDFDNRF